METLNIIQYIRPKTTGAALLLMFLLFYTACRKPEAPKAKTEAYRSMNTALAGSISLWDVYRKLPQTIACNLADSIRLDTARAEWIYQSEGLLTRIPTGSGRNNWLYIFQPLNDPADLKVYAVQFYEEKNDATGFTGKQIWVDMQEWHLYGVSYTNNKPTAFLEPQPLATPGWEACMMDHGDFYLDALGKINFREEEQQAGTGMRPTGGPDGCGGLISHHEKKSFWKWLGDFLGSVFTPGEGNGGTWSNGGFGNTGPGNWIPPVIGGEYGACCGSGGGSSPYQPPSDEPGITTTPPNQTGLFNTVDHPGHTLPPLWIVEGPLGNGPGVIVVENAAVAFVGGVLGLDQQERNWLLQHPDKANRMKSYLLSYIPTLTQDQKKDIMREHLLKMMADQDYYNFVSDYDQNNSGMWWTNENWLDSPVNDFQLCPNQAYEQFQQLTTDEKALVGLYPVQAYVISGNVDIAGNVSENTGLPQPLNGKQDAFRHAFFQAINTRDVPARLPATASQIVHLFAVAHESETPAALQLEKEMDLFNNEVGIDYCWNCFMGITFNNTIRDAIMAKLNNGELKYLNPLDFVLYPNLHGITPITQLKWTNQ